jgi:hypothetical protein
MEFITSEAGKINVEYFEIGRWGKQGKQGKQGKKN